MAPLLFALEESAPLARRLARQLDTSLAPLEDRRFEDGEHKARPLLPVRGRDVYVVQSLHGGRGASVNDKLCRLWFLLATLRDAGAAHLTAVVPYLGYARKDRRTKPRDPVTARYVAQLFEATGVDRVVALDVHNLQAFQNGFRCRTEHLEAHKLMVAALEPRLGSEPLCVLSPDAGGVKRAERFRLVLEEALGREVPAAFIEKHRSREVISGGALVGDVEGRTVVVVDDLIASGGTLARAAVACRRAGARSAVAVATHGAFSEKADAVLREPALEAVYVSSSIDPLAVSAELLASKIHTVDVAPLLAEAVRRLSNGGSLSELSETQRELDKDRELASAFARGGHHDGHGR